MKKSTKLLSVILAIVMLFTSMSVLASAAKTSYQTAEDLENLQAYSPYGTVTRLTTEERLSILFDYLDNVLASANIKMDPIDLSVLGTLNIDLTSINAALTTVDGVKALLDNNSFLIGLLSSMLGIIADVNLDNWQSGMSREGTDHTAIITSLLNVLRDNDGIVWRADCFIVLSSPRPVPSPGAPGFLPRSAEPPGRTLASDGRCRSRREAHVSPMTPLRHIFSTDDLRPSMLSQETFH